MSKFSPNILSENLSELNLTEAINREAAHKTKVLELKRQKSLFDSKHKCIVEIMKLAIQELDYTIKCKLVSPINNRLKSELASTVKSEAQQIINYINSSKNVLEGNLYVDGKFDLFSIEEKEIEVQTIVRMNYWKMTFEDYFAKVSLPIYQTQKFSEDAIIDEVEYAKQKTKVDNTIGDKARFYQSLKRLEDISINEYYDNEAKKISENLKNNSAKAFSVNNSETAATDENNHNGSDSGNETVVMGDEEYFSESMLL